MEQVDSIPFSSLIAGMLLKKESYTPLEIVNKISDLAYMGIMVDDENDDLNIISCCIEMGDDYNFRLKKGLDYSSVLLSGIMVSDFLMLYAGEKVLFILNNNNENFMFQDDILGSNEMVIDSDKGMIKRILIVIKKMVRRNFKEEKTGNGIIKIKRRKSCSIDSFKNSRSSIFHQAS